MEYQEWLKEFTKDKKLIAEFEQSVDAVHGVARYLDSKGAL